MNSCLDCDSITCMEKFDKSGLLSVSGMIVTCALIIWKALMCITGSESPVVVVLSGSMEPGFKRGDILFLHMTNDSIRAGEIIVFNVDVSGLRVSEIPIVHRVIKRWSCDRRQKTPLIGEHLARRRYIDCLQNAVATGNARRRIAFL
ncbi:hypothetical protein FNV43_RR15067 [Rhamnella rubrinervis]|uniref:Signal peptidase complex catalytic subunit SEC11 n=1 Tax=Rhamnella rubrinervis TaxID=2594499 RepID=A0A8K0E2N3_9ROSA|nr:hypothetical protein FNV43_RR15067 [Rhamnella rubrinervis]